MNTFKNRNVLITGGSGMIGRQLTTMLLDKSANVIIADLNAPINMPKEITYKKIDLTNFLECKSICKDVDYVFSLVGIKASPKITMEQPADIMGPMLQFNTNMLKAAMEANIIRYLYTSTIGVYQPAEILDDRIDIWNTQPSKNDWYGGWSKRMGELHCNAYTDQNKIGKCSIVRPANVYGPYDNFDLKNSMVIPSLIRKAYEQDTLEVWGDGTQIRDFIHAKDVAAGMLFSVENNIDTPMNIGSGMGISIKEVAEIISEYFGKPIRWLTDKPTGDKKRILSMEKSNSLGFFPKVSIKEGIISAIEWFKQNKNIIDTRYNILNKNG